MREAISGWYPHRVGCGPIFGMDGTAGFSTPLGGLNHKDGATCRTAIDMASRKNAFPEFKAKNSPQIRRLNRGWSLT